MQNLLDLTNQDETIPVEIQATTQPTAATEIEPAALKVIEEIDPAPKAGVAKAHTGKAVAKPAPHKREELPPNPILLDPYEWDVR